MASRTPLRPPKSSEGSGPRQLRNGQTIEGRSGSYRIVRHIANGAFGELYEARRVRSDQAGAADGRTRVVLKIPRIDENQTLPDKMSQMGNVLRAFAFEKAMLERLSSLSCVPQLIDHGACTLELHDTDVSFPAQFLVEEFVDGVTLGEYMVSAYGDAESKRFEGIRREPEFFFWTRQLALALLAVHQRMVVHGDLWQRNVLINPQREIKIIDFGQSRFRQLTMGIDGLDIETHPCVPPEKRKSVAGDIYALGAILYFLATGEDVGGVLKTRLSIDALKDTVAEAIRKRNPHLYSANVGVVDVICRCLRWDPRQRTPHTLVLLHDIDVMTQEGREISPTPEIASSLERLKARHTPLFMRIAQRRVRELENTIEEMVGDIYDLIGGWESGLRHRGLLNGLRSRSLRPAQPLTASRGRT